MGEFEYSKEGYLKAKKYLQDIGRWEYISTHGFSTDGWTIVKTANYIYNGSKTGVEKNNPIVNL